MSDLVGQQLGTYHLLRLLGEGSFATVYLGEPAGSSLQVAIKVFHTPISSAQEGNLLRQDEVLLTRLKHPNLVRVFAFGLQDTTAFLVMAYVEGGTLRQRHPPGSRLELATVASYLQQLAWALDYLHRHQLVHGNLKPENILLEHGDRVLLGDFSTPLVAQRLHTEGSPEATRTRTYLAPESIQGRIDPASDQYALAILVYEWLAGAPPFAGSVDELSAQHLFATPASLRQQMADLPPAVEQVVLTALAKDPRQRFASVQDFANAFAQASAISVDASLLATQLLSPTAPLPESSVSQQPPAIVAPAAFVPSEVSPLPSTQPPAEPPTAAPAHSFVPLLLEVPALVGRQREWGQVRQLWQRAASGQPQLIVLAGEAGVGKTRLAEELFGWVAQQQLSTARASCYAVEGGLAYAPVGVWLHADAVRSNLSSLPVLWLSEVARFVPEVLVERPSLPPPGTLTESWQRQRLFEALAHAVLAARQPLLLLLDDLQWCDRETLEWLHYLLRFDAQAQLLIVGTLRAEELTSGHPLRGWLATLRREGLMTQIDLELLTADETATLAAQLAGRALDPDRLAQLYQDTEGNALFVVETLRMELGEAEEGEQGGAAPAPPSETGKARLPPTIQAVIGARLEQLSDEAREVVGVAAVIGRAFNLELLAQVSKRDEEALLEALDEIWQRRLMREHEMEGYDFSHAKIREVAYTELPPPRRRLLHRRIAEALETLYADRLDTVSGDIAAHYEQAGSAERAVTYYQRAAEVARQLYANADAISLYHRALALVEKAAAGGARPEKTALLYERSGDVLMLTARYDDARAAYESALALAPRQDRVWQARLHRRIGWFDIWGEEESSFEVEFKHFDLAETLLGPEPFEAGSARWDEWIELQLIRMRAYYGMSKVAELEELAEKVRPLVEQIGSPMQRAGFFARLALAGYLRERYVPSKETLNYQQTALAAIEGSEDQDAIADYRFGLGFCYLWSNELEKAQEQLQLALELAKRVGDLLLESRCLTYLTIHYRKRGEVEKAREYVSQALAVATRVQHIGYIAMARGNMAWLRWREGDQAEAQKQGHAALEAFAEEGEPFEWLALWPLVGVAAVQQQLAFAMQYMRRLLAPEQQRLPDLLAATLEQAIRSWDVHQPETAGTYLQRATALAREMGYL